MKFTSSISAALIAATCFASFSLAAPVSSVDLSRRNGRDSSNSSSSDIDLCKRNGRDSRNSSSSDIDLCKRNGRDSWNSSTPATTTPPTAPAPLATLFPETIAVWNIGLNKIDQWQTSQPIVRGHGTTNGQDLSVLATFNIPSTWAGNQCELVFDLESWNPSSYAAGTMIGDMFSSLKPATSDATGNNRNQPIGQFLAKKGERAATPNGRILFPCSTATYSVEMAPHGQSATTYIGWSSWVDGLKVIVN